MADVVRRSAAAERGREVSVYTGAMQQPDLIGLPNRAARNDIHRLFFALWPDDAARAAIADAVALLASQHEDGGRRINPRRYHLTLQYLGDFDALPQDLVARAANAASNVRASAFDLALDLAGSFRNRSIPWWLGCAAPNAGLQALWDELSLALAKAEVRVLLGGKLVPHVTVLRNAAAALPATAIAPIAWPVREFVLVHSQLGMRNAYDLLGRWHLRA